MSGIICAYYLGWNTLEPRLNNLFNDNMSGRNEIYKSTLQMIESYGFFGSGPGTFETVVQFELGNNLTYWPSWAHSDYLEFTLTFGKAGIIIIIFIAITLLIKIIFCRGQSFTLFGIISLLSVIIHATLDFPLQVLSILVTVCVLSAILTHNDNRLIRSKKIN